MSDTHDIKPENPYTVELPQSLTVLPDGSKPIALGSGTITSIIGEGGAAVVYEIWNDQLGVRRAVKLLRPDNRGETFDRFDTEMRISAQLRHPNIIQIHAVGEWNNLPYLEMERVEGISLERLVRDHGSVPPLVCLAIAVMVCRALEYTHNHEYDLGDSRVKGILHRDLKPANVMIEKDGTAKLMDFGIATPANISMHTMAGTFVGSLQYLAPEQMKAEKASTSSDLYSLGLVMYEMLTGNRAFDEQNMTKLVSQRMNNSYRPLKQYHLKAPGKLKKLIEKCLVFDPDRRISDTSKVLQELETLFSRGTRHRPEEIVDYYLNRHEKTKRSMGIRIQIPVAQIVLATGIVLILGGVAWYFATAPGRESAQQVSSLEIATTLPEEELAKEIEPPSPETRVEGKENQRLSGKKSSKPPSAKKTRKKATIKKTVAKSKGKSKSRPSIAAVAPPPPVPVPAALSPLDRLKADYETDNLMAIIGDEIAKHHYQVALDVYSHLSPTEATSTRGLLYKMRSLNGLGKIAEQSAFFDTRNLHEGEFLLSKAQFRYAQGRFKEAAALLERASVAPLELSSKELMLRKILYTKALAYTGVYEKSGSDGDREKALQNWFDVKYTYRNEQGHAYFARANEEIRRMAKSSK